METKELSWLHLHGPVRAGRHEILLVGRFCKDLCAGTRTCRSFLRPPCSRGRKEIPFLNFLCAGAGEGVEL